MLCWIDDLDAWMAGVARSLRPGGALVLVELHPLVTMVESLDPLVVDFPYAFDGPHVYSGTGTYANRDAAIEWTTVQYAHSIGEVVTAAARAGLRVRPASSSTPRGRSTPGSSTVPRTTAATGSASASAAVRDGVTEPACPMPVLLHPRRARGQPEGPRVR